MPTQQALRFNGTDGTNYEIYLREEEGNPLVTITNNGLDARVINIEIPLGDWDMIAEFIHSQKP